jgi:hypothetical protein
MKIEIFTEGSGTTANLESVEQVKDYFKGNFLPVNDLVDEIDSMEDVTIHILSNEHGYLLGSDNASKLKCSNIDRTEAEFRQSFLQSSSTADVVIVLLTTLTFRDIVTAQWDEIVFNANQASIWCIGASRGALSSVDIDELESTIRSVITYQRVGVAPIDTETKQQLTDIIATQI